MKELGINKVFTGNSHFEDVGMGSKFYRRWSNSLLDILYSLWDRVGNIR